MPLTEEKRTAFANACRRALRDADPAWTDHNAGDPGMTILEVLAYALQDLAAQRQPLADAGRALAGQIAGTAARLAGMPARGEDDRGDARARRARNSR